MLVSSIYNIQESLSASSFDLSRRMMQILEIRTSRILALQAPDLKQNLDWQDSGCGKKILQPAKC